MRLENYKENISPNKIYARHTRKYSYAESIGCTSSSVKESHSKHEQQQNQNQSYILQLQQQLAQQKQKCKWIQENTLRDQQKWLEQLNILEDKFAQVQTEKNQMKTLLKESCQQIAEFKKVKGVAEAMVKMMKKVENKSGDYHEAWRWIKKVIWQYQSICKKGLEWKQAYDIMKRKQHQRNDTFSNSSEDSSELNQF